MVKRALARKVKTKKKPIKKIATKRVNTDSSRNLEKTLIENFVSLQKIMAHLSSRFDNLSNQISKLLELFEISAKALAEKGPGIGRENEKVVKKLDSLLEQNKVIARGLTLLHEKDGKGKREENHEEIPEEEFELEEPPMGPGMKKNMPKREEEEKGDTGQYQKSISSHNKDYEE